MIGRQNVGRFKMEIPEVGCNTNRNTVQLRYLGTKYLGKYVYWIPGNSLRIN